MASGQKVRDRPSADGDDNSRNGRYSVILNDRVLYRDSNHLTVEGSRLLAPLFEPIFQLE